MRVLFLLSICQILNLSFLIPGDMAMIKRFLLRICLGLFMCGFAPAQTLVHDGPATPEQLSLFIPSSLPITAAATVRYRKVGNPAWITGHPLHRIRPDYADSGMPVQDGFAWPIIGLIPGTSYEVEVTIINGAQTTVYSNVMTTRALPAPAGAPTKMINTGSTSAQIQAVLDSAVPGDVIQFATGVYDVQTLVLDRSGTMAQPIYIRGTSRTGAVLQNPDRVLQLLNASDIVIEHLTIHGSGIDSGVAASSRGIRFYDGYIQERVTIRNTIISGVDRAVDVTGEARQLLVYDNTITGNNEWNQDFYPYSGHGSPGSGDGTPDLDQNIFWDDDGIRITGQGNAAFNNTISGFGDALAMENYYTSIGVHFYRNDIRMTGDDAIEGDYGTRNITFYDNRVHNAMTLVSLDPIFGGPFLAARNIGINIGRGPYKFNSPNTGHFLYNNTVVRTLNPNHPWGWVQYNNGDQRAWGYQNNILIFYGTDGLLAIEAGGENPIDFTHNSWFPDGEVWWTNSGGSFASIAAARSGLGATTPVFSGSSRRHEADNISEANPFVTTINLGPDYHTQITTLYSPSLSAGTAPKNTGVAIPGITDGFSGSAPDRGALISGILPVVWGDRSSADEPIEPEPTSLLLCDNRFLVEVDYSTPLGDSGKAPAVTLTSDSGYFWFFSDTNVELLVKVLDGRGINGHFWFFWGAMTDVQYTITVVDTETRGVRTYEGEQGIQKSGNDINAF